MGYVRASQKKEAAFQRKQYAPMGNPKTTKQILGDLYEDRTFLDKIITNKGKIFSLIIISIYVYVCLYNIVK